MPFAGDPAALDAIEEMLQELSTVPSRAAADASETIAALIQEQFDEGVDPYGEAWAPLADSTIARGRFAPPLTDTSDMRGSVAVEPAAGAGITITIDHPGPIHQVGASKAPSWHMPARPILPTGELPEEWEEAISDACDRAYGGRDA